MLTIETDKVTIDVECPASGILAGVITNGKIANGLKHSFVMVLAAWVVLRLVAGG